MKKIMSILIILTLLVGHTGMVFANSVEPEWTWYKDFANSIEINSDDLYPDLPWVDEAYEEFRLKMYMDESEKRGYITASEKEFLNKILDDYIALFLESNTYVYENESRIPESYKDGISKTLHRSNTMGSDYRMFKDGQQVFLCYSIEQIESLIDLITYGIIDEDNRVTDLNGLPTRGDGVIMAVKMAGGEAEALNQSWDSPFVDVPDYAAAYIGYAYNTGILNPVKQGTVWDDSILTYRECIKFYLRSMDFIVSDGEDKDSIVTDKVAYARAPYMKGRFGTSNDSYFGGQKLQGGEPLRNGDLITLADDMLYKTIKDNSLRVIDRLVEKNVFDQQVKKYLDAKEYYDAYGDLNWVFGEDVNDFTKLLDLYDNNYREVRTSSFFLGQSALGSALEKENLIAMAQINLYSSSEDKAIEIIGDFMKDLGLSNSRSEKYAKQVINVPFDKDVHDYTWGYEVSFNELRVKTRYVKYNNVVVMYIYKK